MQEKDVKITRFTLHVLICMQGQRLSIEDARVLYLRRYPQSKIAKKLRWPPVGLVGIERALRELVILKLVSTEPTRWYNGEPYKNDIVLYSVNALGDKFLLRKK